MRRGVLGGFSLRRVGDKIVDCFILAVLVRGFYVRDFLNDKIADFMSKLLRIFSVHGLPASFYPLPQAVYL